MPWNEQSFSNRELRPQFEPQCDSRPINSYRCVPEEQAMRDSLWFQCLQDTCPTSHQQRRIQR